MLDFPVNAGNGGQRIEQLFSGILGILLRNQPPIYGYEAFIRHDIHLEASLYHVDVQLGLHPAQTGIRTLFVRLRASIAVVH